MSHTRLHTYAESSEILFKITLNNVGVDVTLATGDVKIYRKGASPEVANVSTLPTAVDATNAPGLFRWTPTAGEATAEIFAINIRDASAYASSPNGTPAFDENLLTFSTGGNASARFSG